VLNDWDYVTFYKQRVERGDFVILDSDAFEKSGLTPLSDMDIAARMLDPTMIILPDEKYGTADDTVIMARLGARTLEHHDKPYLAVPHGTNMGEYIQCALELWSVKGVVGFGIIEEVYETAGLTRVQAVRILADLFPDCFIHLLGMTESLADLKDPIVQRRAVGTDSCKLVRWGMEELHVDPGLVGTKAFPAYPGRGEGYFERRFLTADQLTVVQTNIGEWREYSSQYNTPSNDPLRVLARKDVPTVQGKG
jgi:hypothetical protein